MIRYPVYILLGLSALFALRVLGNFMNCLIDHRSGVQFDSSRQSIMAGCVQRLNPAYGIFYFPE